MNSEFPHLDIRVETERYGDGWQTTPYLELQCTECENWMRFEDGDILTQSVLPCPECDAGWTIKGERIDADS